MMTKMEHELTMSVLNDSHKAVINYKQMNKNFDDIYRTVKSYQKLLSPWLHTYCQKENIPQEYFVELLAQHIWNLHLEKK